MHEDAQPPTGHSLPGFVEVHVIVDHAPARNLRFGLDMGGVTQPYYTDASSRSLKSGKVYRVLKKGERIPATGSVSIEIQWWMNQPGWEHRFAVRSYWARYQDNRGRTWQTVNPADEGSQLLGPRRVRFVPLLERREALARTAMHQAKDRELYSRPS